MKEYQARHDTDAVVRLSDNMIVGPEHEEEWYEYQSWLTEGNIPEEPEPLPDVLPEPTIQEKLQRAGITIEELKTALGL